MFKEFHELPIGTLFQWRSDIFEKIADVFDEKNTLQGGLAKRIMFFIDGEWHHTDGEEQNFNPYCLCKTVVLKTIVI